MESFHGAPPFILNSPHLNRFSLENSQKDVAAPVSGGFRQQAESARRYTGFASGGASGGGRYVAPCAVPFAAYPLAYGRSAPETIRHA